MKRLLVLALLLLLPLAQAADYLAVDGGGTAEVRVWRHDSTGFTEIQSFAVSNQGTDFSPNKDFFAFGKGSTPFVNLYSVSGDTFTPLSISAAPGQVFHMDFSEDGQFFATAGAVSPYMKVYTISGTTFTGLSAPATIPTGTAQSVAFSPDGNFLAVAHATSPYLSIYSISGTTFTKLPDPATLPTGLGIDVSWTDDSSKLAVAHSGSPYVTVYGVSGATFTKLSNPTLPTGATVAGGVDFNAQGTLLAATTDGAPPLLLYSVEEDSFTKLADLATPATGANGDLSFNEDGSALAVPLSVSPWLKLYSVVGTTLSLTSNPPNVPAGTLNGASFASGIQGATQIFCAEPLAVRFGYNFEEGWDYGTAPVGDIDGQVFYSSAQSDNFDFLGLGLDGTSRAYTVDFSVEASGEGRVSTFKAVFSFDTTAAGIPSVGNKGNAVDTGMSENSVRVTFREDGADWDVELHSVVDGASTEDADTTIGDNPESEPTTTTNSFRFVVDTRSGNEEYRIERYDGAVILNAAIPAAHIDAMIGSQWFVNQGSNSFLNTITAIESEEGNTGVSTCVTDLEGVSSVNAPPPRRPRRPRRSRWRHHWRSTILPRRECWHPCRRDRHEPRPNRVAPGDAPHPGPRRGDGFCYAGPGAPGGRRGAWDGSGLRPHPDLVPGVPGHPWRGAHRVLQAWWMIDPQPHSRRLCSRPSLHYSSPHHWIGGSRR